MHKEGLAFAARHSRSTSSHSSSSSSRRSSKATYCGIMLSNPSGIQILASLQQAAYRRPVAAAEAAAARTLVAAAAPMLVAAATGRRSCDAAAAGNETAGAAAATTRPQDICSRGNTCRRANSDCSTSIRGAPAAAAVYAAFGAAAESAAAAFTHEASQGIERRPLKPARLFRGALKGPFRCYFCCCNPVSRSSSRSSKSSRSRTPSSGNQLAEGQRRRKQHQTLQEQQQLQRHQLRGCVQQPVQHQHQQQQQQQPLERQRVSRWGPPEEGPPAVYEEGALEAEEVQAETEGCSQEAEKVDGNSQRGAPEGPPLIAAARCTLFSRGPEFAAAVLTSGAVGALQLHQRPFPHKGALPGAVAEAFISLRRQVDADLLKEEYAAVDWTLIVPRNLPYSERDHRSRRSFSWGPPSKQKQGGTRGTPPKNTSLSKEALLRCSFSLRGPYPPQQETAASDEGFAVNWALTRVPFEGSAFEGPLSQPDRGLPLQATEGLPDGLPTSGTPMGHRKLLLWIPSPATDQRILQVIEL
ncbi:hypothetical protein Esti_001450 [Eimeria stiedai]